MTGPATDTSTFAPQSIGTKARANRQFVEFLSRIMNPELATRTTGDHKMANIVAGYAVSPACARSVIKFLQSAWPAWSSCCTVPHSEICGSRRMVDTATVLTTTMDSGLVDSDAYSLSYCFRGEEPKPTWILLHELPRSIGEDVGVRGYQGICTVCVRSPLRLVHWSQPVDCGGSFAAPKPMSGRRERRATHREVFAAMR